MKILVTGGAGFVGSHIAEKYAREGHEVVLFDNLSRGSLLNRDIKNLDANINFLKQFKNVSFINADIRNSEALTSAAKESDVLFHIAAQTAVTASVSSPKDDFEVNALGTFNALEAARLNDVKSFIYASTNKVYGGNVNSLGVREVNSRYSFDETYAKGVPETLSIDLCEHTPYGVSKLAGDLYTQDYSYIYGLKTGVFRMSCIYGTRQFGVEDQGWIFWFALATLQGKPITIYGDGKQVRDTLFVTDLVELYDLFVKSNLKHVVVNAGGGPSNTLSLLELLDILEKLTGKRSETKFDDWRPSDQKVFVADISKAKSAFNWRPKISPEEGVKVIVDWIQQNKAIFF